MITNNIVVTGIPGLVENVHVFNFGDAVRASKFPMLIDAKDADDQVVERTHKLAGCPSQSGEDNFLSGIVVKMDLTLTNKCWIEFERYHFAQIVSSQSSMHRLSVFDLEKSFIDYVDPRIVTIMQTLQKQYAATKAKQDYLKLLYSCPAGLKLTAQVVTNYRQLKSMYRQRKSHALPEWRSFTSWMKMLPHSDWITNCKDESEED